MWRRESWVRAVGLVLVAGCAGDKKAIPTVASTAAADFAPARGTESVAYKLARTADSAGSAAPRIPGAAVKLIRSAELRMQVLSVEQALRLIDAAAKSRGAMVADAHVTQNDDKRHDARLVIRVPAERFDDLLTALRPLGDVKNENISSDDATKAYADLETRLVVGEATVVRMRALLADRTAKLSDVLEVERELAREIEAIERMKGERRFYDQQIAVSSVAVTLFEPPVVVRPQIGAPIKVAFARAVDVLTVSASWVVYFVTFLAPWVVLVGTAWWALARLSARWPFRKADRILEPVSPGG